MPIKSISVGLKEKQLLRIQCKWVLGSNPSLFCSRVWVTRRRLGLAPVPRWPWEKERAADGLMFCLAYSLLFKRSTETENIYIPVHECSPKANSQFSVPLFPWTLALLIYVYLIIYSLPCAWGKCWLPALQLPQKNTADISQVCVCSRSDLNNTISKEKEQHISHDHKSKCKLVLNYGFQR